MHTACAHTRYTSSSSQYSSSAPLDSISSEDPPNPFLPHCINFMLNCHGSPMNKTARISGPVPRLMGGHSVAFGTDQFTLVRKLTEGGFATIFTARQGDQQKALKVDSNVICRRRHRSSLVTVGVVLCSCRFRLLLMSGRWSLWRSSTPGSK